MVWGYISSYRRFECFQSSFSDILGTLKTDVFGFLAKLISFGDCFSGNSHDIQTWSPQCRGACRSPTVEAPGFRSLLILSLYMINQMMHDALCMVHCDASRCPVQFPRKMGFHLSSFAGHVFSWSKGMVDLNRCVFVDRHNDLSPWFQTFLDSLAPNDCNHTGCRQAWVPIKHVCCPPQLGMIHGQILVKRAV